MVPLNAHPADRLLSRMGCEPPGTASTGARGRGQDSAGRTAGAGVSLAWLAGAGEWLLPYTAVWLAREAVRRGIGAMIHEPYPSSQSAAHLLGLRSVGQAPAPLIGAIRRREVVSTSSEGIRYLNLGRDPLEARRLVDLRVRHVLADGALKLELAAGLHQMVLPAGTALPLRWVDRLSSVAVLASPGPARLMGCYAMLKSLWRRRPDLRVHLVVAGPCMAVEAEAAHRFLTRTCQRFLGREPLYAGSVMAEGSAWDGPRFDGGLPLCVRDGHIQAADPPPAVQRELAGIFDHLCGRGPRGNRMTPRVPLTPLLLEQADAAAERPSAA